MNKGAYTGHFDKITHFLNDLTDFRSFNIFEIPVFICQPGDQKYFPIFGEGLYIVNAFHTLEGPSRSTLNQFHRVSKHMKPTCWNLKKNGFDENCFFLEQVR